jgi:hypothetical protein
MQFSAEIWRQSDNIQALGDFSKLIGEKSPIRCQRVKGFAHATADISERGMASIHLNVQSIIVKI